MGDIITADVKIIKAVQVKVDQAPLTGESLPVDKEKGDIAWAGSGVKQGEFEAIVTETGSNTFFGKSASLMSETESEVNK